ncbi:MAG: hypothetical protein JXB42_12700 [Deltaproteobacteria bacterium]|nr:hypothetical protein [Deltaproteobacteria bacterium]
MINLKGSHGTTKEIAAKIMSGRFRLTGGRFLKGAYFWRESYYWYDLAVGWYKYCADNNRYDEDSPECAIIIAKLCCNDDELIDLDRDDIKDRLARLSEAKNTDQYSNKQIYALYTYFIREIEKRRGFKFKLFLMKVPPPREEYCPRYKTRILGYPTAIIAVSNSCIIKKECVEGKT